MTAEVTTRLKGKRWSFSKAWLSGWHIVPAIVVIVEAWTKAKAEQQDSWPYCRRELTGRFKPRFNLVSHPFKVTLPIVRGVRDIGHCIQGPGTRRYGPRPPCT